MAHFHQEKKKKKNGILSHQQSINRALVSHDFSVSCLQ